METNDGAIEKTEETAKDFQGTGMATGFENVKNRIADKLQSVAKELGEKAADPEGKSGMAQHGKRASEWMDHSAEYVRKFDYKKADEKVREYVKQSPGRSLIIAGAAGLILGVFLRRR
jgi:ElaB/YqjD/DUF883 family membrane-anchored ribosome-binding protein